MPSSLGKSKGQPVVTIPPMDGGWEKQPADDYFYQSGEEEYNDDHDDPEDDDQDDQGDDNGAIYGDQQELDRKRKVKSRRDEARKTVDILLPCWADSSLPIPSIDSSTDNTETGDQSSSDTEDADESTAGSTSVYWLGELNVFFRF